jgi:hypothetical protein
MDAVIVDQVRDEPPQPGCSWDLQCRKGSVD